MLVLLALPNALLAEDDARAPFFGIWGTAQQCARAPIKPGGSVLAEPFEIGAEWLKQGPLWCGLDWFPVQARQNGAFTGARAQCGEDSIQGYNLRMELSDDALTLRWGFLISNGPLMRCPAS